MIQFSLGAPLVLLLAAGWHGSGERGIPDDSRRSPARIPVAHCAVDT